MEIYPIIEDYLSSSPSLREWAEALILFRKVSSLKPKNWGLPLQACEAVGGSLEQALPAMAALACVQISILLIDDMLDDDPRGEYRFIGHAQAANFASAFVSAATDAILSSLSQPRTKLSILERLSSMVIATAHGQFFDTINPSDEAGYWKVVEMKSAPFFGCALYMGASLGGATVTIANRLESIGKLYGEMIQIHDDLADAFAVPASPDWILGRTTLPVLFALSVNHTERAKFIELMKEISDPVKLYQAQNILIRCGAVSFCVDQLLKRYSSVMKLLDSLPLVKREPFVAMLEELAVPAWRLLNLQGDRSEKELKKLSENNTISIIVNI